MVLHDDWSIRLGEDRPDQNSQMIKHFDGHAKWRRLSNSTFENEN